MRQSLNPIGLLHDGFDWSGRSRRSALAIAQLALIACLLAAFLGAGQDWPRWILGLLWLLAAVLIIPALGHIHRRLNDLGWSHWAWWLTHLPVVGQVFVAVLCLRAGGQRRATGGQAGRILSVLFTLILTLVALTRTFWDPYILNSGHMKPTLLTGDYVLASAGQYTPDRGDVIMFRHPDSARNEVMISRVIGLPGDRVQMIDGTVHLNDIPLPQEVQGTFEEVLARQGQFDTLPRCENGAVAMGALCRKTQLSETLPDGHSYQILNIGTQRSDTTGVFTVPLGHLFVLSDNRDNAADSRIAVTAFGLGFVPIDNVRGRADRIVFSAPGRYLTAFWTWRWDRSLMAIE